MAEAGADTVSSLSSTHVLVPSAVEPKCGIPRSRRIHAPAQPRAGDRRVARTAHHRHHRHRVPRRRKDRDGAAAPDHLRRSLPVEPNRRANHCRPEEGSGGQGSRSERTATAIPEARKPARNVTGARGAEDRRFMAEAVALGEAARGQSAPNPNVGCVIVSPSAKVVGRGTTAAGGRPHAEAIALEQTGKKAKGATVYVTLEPCAHESPRGPACTQLLLQAKPARVVIALKDPDSRTAGQGIRLLRGAGIDVTLGVGRNAARRSLNGWLTRLRLGRPRVTLKLALSIDGKIALPSG